MFDMLSNVKTHDKKDKTNFSVYNIAPGLKFSSKLKNRIRVN